MEEVKLFSNFNLESFSHMMQSQYTLYTVAICLLVYFIMTFILQLWKMYYKPNLKKSRLMSNSFQRSMKDEDIKNRIIQKYVWSN